MSRPVTVQYRKYPDRAHWRHDLRYLGEDGHGVWLGGPAGTTVQRGEEPARAMDWAFVQLVTRDRWWSLIANADGRYPVYVDISTPAVWSEAGARVEMIDLDLDVVRDADGGVKVLDEDEFLEHSRDLGYPEWMVARARATAAEIVMWVEGGREPFGRAAERWLDAVR